MDSATQRASELLANSKKSSTGSGRGIRTNESAAQRQFNDWWKEDSATVQWALARLTTDRSIAGRYVTGLAAQEYLRLSGRSWPILASLEGNHTEDLPFDALSAIRTLDDLAEEAVVFRYACDAAWLLSVLRSDTSYAAWAWNASASLQWPLDARYVLEESRRLILGPYREDLDSLVSGLEQ